MRIGLLGPLQVQDDSGRPVPVGGRRVRALLILLALDAGRVVPAYSLIERLWNDDGPADAANALQSLVSRLRAALRAAGLPGELVESTAVGYRLSVPPDAVDAVVFETRALAGGDALADGDAATAARVLREALGAWRGPALADVAGEEFAAAAASRLEELRFAAVLDRIEADLTLGETSGLTGELRALTAAEPLAERPRALLIRALAAAGRQAEALGSYAEARELLADRLGVDPSPQLEQAYLDVLRQDSPVPAPAAHGARSDRRPVTSFIGRDGDISHVLEKLAGERLVTLTGPGGVGKTRLAAEAADRLGTPVWFVELAPVTDPAEVPHAVLGALGLGKRVVARYAADAAMAAAPLDRLSDALSGREAVLVVDNCEHVVEAAAALAERILADCPRVTILATSREPLRIGGEVLWVVAPLPHGSAVELLIDRAAAVQPGFAADDENAAAIARICRALDGMPLAIELAAAWLRTLTAAQLAERLDDRFALLTNGSRTALPRHRTLRAVVDWSWGLLSDAERVLARRLAVFPAGATLAAAEQVCADAVGAEDPAPADGPVAADGPVHVPDPPVPAGDPLLPRGAVLSALSGLVGKSIVTATEGRSESGPRYRMLETIRAYGLERLAEAGEEDSVKDACASYYLTFAETADPLLRTAGQTRWFRELTAEQDNIHAALRWVIARRDAGRGLRFVRALGYFWVQHGHGEGDALARDVLALGMPPGESQRIAEARAICALLAAGWSWDIESVRAALAEAAASLDRWAADSARLHPLAVMAGSMLMMYDGDYEQALAAFRGYARFDDPWMRAMGRLYCASYTASLGNLEGTDAECEAALREFRAIGDKWGTAITLAQLAEFAELRADHVTAIKALEEATALGREFGPWGDMGYVEAKLAVIRARAGDVDRARAEMDQAAHAAAERGHISDADAYLGFRGAEMAWLEGDLAGVMHSCAAVLADVADARAEWWQSLRGQVKARMAMAALAQGDAPRSRELLAAALQAASAWVDRPPIAVVVDAIAVYALRRGDAELAATLLGAAHLIRGTFDESSLDAPAARAAARSELGTQAFDAAYTRGRELGFDAALALAREVAGRAAD